MASSRLIPHDSPLRRIPEAVDRKTVLFLDGIRYSVQSIELASYRLAQNLHGLAGRADDSSVLRDGILEATLDAWTMVDAVHRLRELLQQMPGLKQNQPELQIFLRKTRQIEDLRHFFQHFRTEIGAFVSRAMPLWGTISWASSDEETGFPVNYTIIPGTFFPGAQAAGCVFDTKKGVFVQRVLLRAGPHQVDLADLIEEVERFVRWYEVWFQKKYSGEKRLASDACLTFKIQPVVTAC